MSEEKKKKKKKKAIIAGIIGSVALIGGGVGGIIATIPETEAKNEEENEEEKKKPPTTKSQPILKIELATALPENQRNLATIETNGQSLTEEMIKAKLPTNIDKSQVEVTNITDKSATVKAISNSAKYKGNIKVNFTIDKSEELSKAFTNLNLATIETNGQSLTEEMIKAKLPTNIDKSQVEVTNITDKSATVKAISNSAKYKGNIKVNFTIDKSEELSKVFTNLNLATIETNGQSLTEEMIKAKLPTNIDKSQVEVTNITDKSRLFNNLCIFVLQSY